MNYNHILCPYAFDIICPNTSIIFYESTKSDTKKISFFAL